MSLADITNTIHEEAEGTRKQLLEDADKKIEALKASYKDKQRELEKAFNAETDQLKQQNIATVTGKSEREEKEIIDSAKRELVDRVFEQALKKVATLDDAEYKEVLVSYLKTLPTTIGKCEVFAGSDRMAVTKKALLEAKVSGVVHEDTAITQGGCRVVGDEFEYDFTFPRMMHEKKNALEIAVAGTLFGSQE